MSLQTLILDSIMDQIIQSQHYSSIIQKDEIEQAIKFHPLLGSIVLEMESNDDLCKYVADYKQAKQETKKYKKYFFTEEAIMVLQNLYNFIQDKFPTRNALQKRFPLHYIYIAQLYTQPPKENKIKFEPKEVQIDLSKPLFHTTNAFEIFEMKDVGTPYGPAWFTINKIFSPEFVQDFHPSRGGVRVIKYKWIPSSEIDLTTEYPFIDLQTKTMPKIMDARKLKMIPPSAIEKFYETKGMILSMPYPNPEENILMTYGKTWRPFVVKYLESMAFEGILTKQNEIVLFHPEKWVTFENIEQGDMFYSAIIEALKTRNRNKIPEIAQKYNIDTQSLFILFNRNLENVPPRLQQIKSK